MAALLKDLYNEEYIDLLSHHISAYYKDFKSQNFKTEIFNKEWQTEELKQRMRHISTLLGLYLPQNYKESINILKLTFHQLNYAFSLENMIFQDFVEVYGLHNFELSMDALAHFTINSSSEFAIRQFILLYPEQTMQQMKIWASSKNEHIRRLASEGCRPRLPWAVALTIFKADPYPVLEILELLKRDTSAYVRKSVANNLNDISKEHPKLVISLTKKWLKESPNLESLLKHGCRTLLKDSNKEALRLFGFKEIKNIELRNFNAPEEVSMPNMLFFTFELISDKNLGKLRIEFSLEFMRKNNKRSKKVFKISEGIFKEHSKKIQKSYSFKPITTRVYYQGLHTLSIILNGEVLQTKEFMLT